jgi:hypothetical protein
LQPSWKTCMLCYNVASPRKVKLMCWGAFGRASAINRDFAKRTVEKGMPFHCLLVFGQAHRSPVLDSDARAVVRRSSSDVTRGAQLAADPLNVVA